MIPETLDAMDKPTSEEEKNNFLNILKPKKEFASKIVGYLSGHSKPK